MITLDIDNKKFDIVVVGCGGTGSQLIPFLMQLSNNIKDKIKSITLIDGDVYEDSNLRNQKITKSDVGFKKAKVLAERYSYIFEELDINYYDEYILSWHTLDDITGYNVILLGCTDNNPSRRILCEFMNKCDNKNIIYIDSGNGTDNRIGQIVVGYKDYGNKILNHVGDIFTDIYSEENTIKSEEHCFDVINEKPQNIATNIYAAANVFNVITNILMFGKIENNVLFFNADKINVYGRG